LLDTFKHKGLRNRLVDSLQAKGITDPLLLDAMRKVPRHFFVDSAFHDSAYEDIALPIHENQTISQPYTVAYQTQMLALKSGMKLLEIGTGSGYQTAILCAMGIKVFTIEFYARLHRIAKERLEELDYSPFMKVGDGSQGWSQFQPFERILVTAASPTVPEALQKQLEIGGKLVVPVGNFTQQQMYCITRLSRDEFEVEKHEWFRFVPLQGRYGFQRGS
jgi:protein-L-isoaspartate(D-aspartate) O-methyltransferase